MANSLEDIGIDEIYDFIEVGSRDNAPKGMIAYLEQMDKVRGMYLRIDKYASKDAILNHLKKVDGLSHYLANKLYNQTIEYFYCDTDISKAAWRNVYAEKMEKVINFAIAKMVDTADASKVAKMILDIGKLRGLDQPDKEELPESLFNKPFKLYTTDPEAVGIPKADRRGIAEFIDNLSELNELQKEAIKREAGALPFQLFLETTEDPRHE